MPQREIWKEKEVVMTKVGRDLRYNQQTAGGSSAPGREGGTGALPGPDCWPEPSSRAHLSTLGGTENIFLHHQSSPSAGGEAKSQRAGAGRESAQQILGPSQQRLPCLSRGND